jgi:hypothetical protein
MKTNPNAVELGIGTELYNQFDMCMMTLWNVAHSLDKLTLIQLIVKEYGFPRESVYHRCGDDLQNIKEMYVEIVFTYTMEEMGITERKGGNTKMWRYIEYWRDL